MAFNTNARDAADCSPFYLLYARKKNVCVPRVLSIAPFSVRHNTQREKEREKRMSNVKKKYQSSNGLK